MAKIIIIAAIITLTGCSSYRAIIAEYSATASDASLETAEWGICKASTAGALERRYQLFSNPDGDKPQAINTLCY